MSKKRMAPFIITPHQYEWLEREKQRTGNTFAAIVRGLIQEEISKEKRKK